MVSPLPSPPEGAFCRNSPRELNPLYPWGELVWTPRGLEVRC